MQRRVLGALFAVIALAFLGIAIAAVDAGGRAWVIAVAAVAIGGWLATLSLKALGIR